MSGTPIIDAGRWTLFDKIQYGGLGYGVFSLPSNFFTLIIAICFPPLGQVINIIGKHMSNEFPYITVDTFAILLDFDNMTQIIYSFVLTCLFYIPGLIYVLGNIADSDKKQV